MKTTNCTDHECENAICGNMEASKELLTYASVLAELLEHKHHEENSIVKIKPETEDNYGVSETYFDFAPYLAIVTNVISDENKSLFRLAVIKHDKPRMGKEELRKYVAELRGVNFTLAVGVDGDHEISVYVRKDSLSDEHLSPQGIMAYLYGCAVLGIDKYNYENCESTIENSVGTIH